VICVTSSECVQGYVHSRKGKCAGGGVCVCVCVCVWVRNERNLGVVNVSVVLAHSSAGRTLSHTLPYLSGC